MIRRERRARALRLVALLQLAGCLPGDGSVFLRIDAPEDGQVVSGNVPVELAYRRPVGLRHFAHAFDGAPLDRIRPEGVGLGAIATLSLGNGPHRYTVAMEAWGFRSWQDSVEFVVDNPSQRLLRVEGSRPVAAGSTLELRLEYNEPGLAVRATQLDRGPLGALQAEARGLGERDFALTLRIPGDLEPRQHELTLEARNAAGRGVSQTLQLRVEPPAPSTAP